jgi:trehalose-6-phosphate synthase
LSETTTTRRKLLVVFNRAPVAYARDGDGARVARRGGGGVVTALRGLLAQHDVTWVASAMTEEDRAVAAERGGSWVEETADGAAYRLRLVSHDPAAYERFYNVVANPTLWYLQHYLWGLGSAPDFDPIFHEAWSGGYVPVNEAFARATLEELDHEPDAAVLFHDYHLYCTALRNAHRCRDLPLRPHPWPAGPRARACRRSCGSPAAAARERRRGFHTERWRRAFRSGRALPGAR